jgi:hypothetical protein
MSKLDQYILNFVNTDTFATKNKLSNAAYCNRIRAIPEEISSFTVRGLINTTNKLSFCRLNSRCKLYVKICIIFENHSSSNSLHLFELFIYD